MDVAMQWPVASVFILLERVEYRYNIILFLGCKKISKKASSQSSLISYALFTKTCIEVTLTGLQDIVKFRD